MLVVARSQDARTGTLRPALAVVPTDAPGFQRTLIPVEITGPEKQFALFFDDVRLPRGRDGRRERGGGASPRCSPG